MICNCPFRNAQEGQSITVKRGHLRCAECGTRWTVEGITGIYRGDYFDRAGTLYHRVIVDRRSCPGCGRIVFDWRTRCDTYQPNLDEGIAVTGAFTWDEAPERMGPVNDESS